MTHRLYVDEVGNPGFAPHVGPNERYLSLTGVIFELEHITAVVTPAVEQLKAEFFPTHATDRPLVLHRKELMNANHPFATLRDPAVRGRFDRRLIDLLTTFEFTAIVVTIDKPAHYGKYTNPAHPYHYCMHAMVERFVGWLHDENRTGDVLAESRGKKEDRALCKAFAEAVENGTNWPREMMQRRLARPTLGIATKSDNEAGLQVADPIAHPCFKRALARRLRREPPGGFAGQIAEAIKPKLRRGPNGKILGFGIKWFP